MESGTVTGASSNFGTPRRRLTAWPLIRSTSRGGLIAAALSVIFLAVHLPFLSANPGGIDAANFALGVRDFDVVDHRPHPPGYPVFIALGKVSDAVLSVFPATARHEARALAFWSALAGSLSIFPLLVFFRSLEFDSRRVAAAIAVTLTCPLFWFLSVRELSDVPGLAAALVPQALLLAAFREGGPALPGSPAGSDSRFVAKRLIVIGAFTAGFVIGLRSQTVWLTLPLLAVVLASRVRREGLRLFIYAAVAFVAGVLVWAIPALVASGGSVAYLGALEKQGLEDLAGVDLLVTNPTPVRLIAGLVQTFAFPWADRYLALVVFVLGMLGAIAMALRSRGALALLLVAVAPYGLFHLLFQESISTRYALPLIPALAYLAVRGLDAVAPRVMLPGAALLSLASFAIAMPIVVAYARAGSPAYQAVAQIEDRLAQDADLRPVLASHHAIGRALRAAELPIHALTATPKHEWLELVKYWRGGGDAPIWFLAEPRRTDLALIDPASRRLLGSYGWTFSRRSLVSGVRPDAVDWHEIRSPGWFVAEGWSLTPEVQGVSTSDRRGPGDSPIVAYVLRRPEAATVMIGGRNLGLRGDREARVEVTLDGRPLDAWTAPPEDRPFLTTRTIPAGMLTGGGRYATLEIRARAADGSARPVNVAIEQFDLQPLDSPLVGFESGWYQNEYDPAVGRTWRWMGSSATVRVHHGGRDRTLQMRAEVPLQYLNGSPTILVRAGEQIVARVTPTRDDLRFEARVPARALDEAAGLLTLETDGTYVPAAVQGPCSCDQRALGLRVYDLRIH